MASDRWLLESYKLFDTHLVHLKDSCEGPSAVVGAGDAEVVSVLVVNEEVGQQGDHVHGGGQVLGGVDN